MKRANLIIYTIFLMVANQALGSSKWCDVDIVPEHPNSCDVVDITLSGWWCNSCTPNNSAVLVVGDNIYFDVILDYPPGTCCAAVATPWERTISVGPLPIGTYTVYARIVGYPLTPEIYKLVTEFTVTAKTIYYVDIVNGNDLNNGLTIETAFATIQKGLNSAEDGDLVSVYPGVYNETIDFLGKAITVQSAEDAPILRAQDYFAVLFYSGEGPDSILKNFVIENSFIAIFLDDSSPTIKNVTAANNGFGIAAYGTAQPDISNSIFWNNIYGDLFGCQARYSCIQDGCAGPGNLDIDPRFADPNGSDYHLQSRFGRYWPQYDLWVLDEAISPCIDGGDPNDGYCGEPMPNGGRINMGAFGGTAYASKKEMRWLPADLNHDGWVNLMDFATLAENWLRYEPGTSNLPPEVSIINPQNGNEFERYETILIEVDAWDPDGSVEWVEFLVDGAWIGEDSDGSDGWETSWQSSTDGQYNLTAEATDDDGATTTSQAVEICIEGPR